MRKTVIILMLHFIYFAGVFAQDQETNFIHEDEVFELIRYAQDSYDRGYLDESLYEEIKKGYLSVSNSVNSFHKKVKMELGNPITCGMNSVKKIKKKNSKEFNRVNERVTQFAAWLNNKLNSPFGDFEPPQTFGISIPFIIGTIYVACSCASDLRAQEYYRKHSWPRFEDFDWKQDPSKRSLNLECIKEVFEGN